MLFTAQIQVHLVGNELEDRNKAVPRDSIVSVHLIKIISLCILHYITMFTIKNTTKIHITMKGIA